MLSGWSYVMKLYDFKTKWEVLETEILLYFYNWHLWKKNELRRRKQSPFSMPRGK